MDPVRRSEVLQPAAGNADPFHCGSRLSSVQGQQGRAVRIPLRMPRSDQSEPLQGNIAAVVGDEKPVAGIAQNLEHGLVRARSDQRSCVAQHQTFLAQDAAVEPVTPGREYDLASGAGCKDPAQERRHIDPVPPRGNGASDRCRQFGGEIDRRRCAGRRLGAAQRCGACPYEERAALDRSCRQRLGWRFWEERDMDCFHCRISGHPGALTANEATRSLHQSLWEKRPAWPLCRDNRNPAGTGVVARSGASHQPRR